jgi:hypothetical protein
MSGASSFGETFLSTLREKGGHGCGFFANHWCRLPGERHIFSVVAAVTLVRSEADQDLHLVLEDGPAHMIAESPSAPACTVNATAYRRRQMRDARNAVRLCAQARVVGVEFWDNQTGVAPNAIELHPILGFACLS